MKSDLLLPYINKWVALNKERTKVLAVAKEIDKLDKMVKKSKMSDVIYHYVLPFHYAP
jgi:hypothetical protein